MSERGSLVTEFIYCNKCFNVAKKVFLEHPERGKFLWVNSVSNWGDEEKELPILAGKIGESYDGGELVFFEHEIMPSLEKVICHPIRVAILCDTNNGALFRVAPAADEEGSYELTEFPKT